jgi:hypothetical protein
MDTGNELIIIGCGLVMSGLIFLSIMLLRSMFNLHMKITDLMLDRIVLLEKLVARGPAP